MKPKTVNDTLREGTRQLSGETAQLDAELLIAHVLGKDRSWALAHSDEQISTNAVSSFDNLIADRAKGVPLAYLVGAQEFYGHEFTVSPDVLVPRPESEQLVDLVLQYAEKAVIDVGTGSGCIGISVALKKPQLDVLLTDTSEKALNIARKNAENLNARVKIKKTNLLDEVTYNTDSVIVANLPYVPMADYNANPDLLHEPASALVAGDDGLDLIKALIAQIKENGVYPRSLLLEIDPSQVEAIQKVVYWPITIHQDLAGRDRTIEISERRA